MAIQLPGAPPPWTNPNPEPIQGLGWFLTVLSILAIGLGYYIIKRLVFDDLHSNNRDMVRVKRREKRLRRELEKVFGRDALWLSAETLAAQLRENQAGVDASLHAKLDALNEIERLRFESRPRS